MGDPVPRRGQEEGGTHAQQHDHASEEEVSGGAWQAGPAIGLGAEPAWA